MAAAADDGSALPGARMPTRRYEARRNAIIASAVNEINAKGVRGMTLGDVAARLGLVPTGVIYYFRNKDDLAAACFRRAIERYEALISAGEHAGDDDRTRLAGFVRAFFEFEREAELGATERIAVFNDLRALNSVAVREAYAGMFRHARQLLRGPPGARLPRLDQDLRTHLLLSELFWSVDWIKMADVNDYGRVAERMITVLCDGLAAPGMTWETSEPPPLIGPRTAEAERSGELFLRAAAELINQEGYHGASVERISARLSVSKGAFYHHNATKDELVIACFHRTCEIMWRAIRAAEAEGGSGLKVLAQICAALTRYQLTGNLPLLRSSALTTVPGSIREDLVREFDRVSLRFASIVSDGIADGSVRPVDVNIAAQMIMGLINASADLDVWSPGLTPRSATTRYVRPLFEGLLSPAAAEA